MKRQLRTSKNNFSYKYKLRPNMSKASSIYKTTANGSKVMLMSSELPVKVAAAVLHEEAREVEMEGRIAKSLNYENESLLKKVNLNSCISSMLN